jgi:dynein heavy chain
VVAS